MTGLPLATLGAFLTAGPTDFRSSLAMTAVSRASSARRNARGCALGVTPTTPVPVRSGYLDIGKLDAAGLLGGYRRELSWGSGRQLGACSSPSGLPTGVEIPGLIERSARSGHVALQSR
jgi:hypothetical protein